MATNFYNSRPLAFSLRYRTTTNHPFWTKHRSCCFKWFGKNSHTRYTAPFLKLTLNVMSKDRHFYPLLRQLEYLLYPSAVRIYQPDKWQTEFRDRTVAEVRSCKAGAILTLLLKCDNHGFSQRQSTYKDMPESLSLVKTQECGLRESWADFNVREV